MENNLKNVGVFEFFNSVSVSLVNYERNYDFLQSVPHKKYMDLAIIVKWKIDNLDDERSEDGIYIDISNKDIQSWGISAEEMINIALANTINLNRPFLAPLNTIVQDMDLPADNVFLLTNHQMYYGASLICYKDIMELIYERMESEYYVIPSSIHEVLIIKDDDMINPTYMKDAIRCINEFYLQDSDYLSDNLYKYSSIERKLLIV
ncbi:MAG: DUF5688 family protein [Eubacterium sp.]|nr:DUF5688 family protein [Eubacterium sp.]